MLDSYQLAAFVAVVREGSFEKAAATLHVTRSAVSQRVKLLEERLGQVLVQRSSPCQATAAGQTLLRHAQQVALSEADTLRTLGAAPEAGAAHGPHLAVGVNADSLATWFIAALAAAQQALPGTTFDVLVEDQDHSSDLLREGRVMGAVTAEPRAVQGCEVHALGTMRYRAVASPGFMAQHFPGGAVDAAHLARAPMLVFNRKDGLQHVFLRRITRRALQPPVHWLPSPEGFVRATQAGMGWGMVPDGLLHGGPSAQGLVELRPGAPVDVPLFWQCWRLHAPTLQGLTTAIRQAAAQALQAA